jgi:hypothetical protein
VTVRLLDRLVTRASRAGARVLVLFLPYEMDLAPRSDYRAATDRIVSAIATHGVGAGYDLLDLRDRLGQDAPRIFLDSMHFTPEGHGRIARVLAQWIETNGLAAVLARK